VHPQVEEEVNFSLFYAGQDWSLEGVVDLAVLVCVLRVTTKKSHQLFREKSAPSPRENPGYACVLLLVKEVLTL